MIQHGFSYKDLAEMELSEIIYWAKALSEYYEKFKEDN